MAENKGSKGIRIGVIGGSGYYTPYLVSALCKAPSLIDIDEIVLHGRDGEKLGYVAGVCRNLVNKAGKPWKLTATTDMVESISGSQFVIAQIRVGGLRARRVDETFSLDFGIPGEETTGPGGFSSALRTIPAMAEIARLISEYAPKAWLVNLTNPCGVIMSAIHAIHPKSVGLCELPVITAKRVLKAYGYGASSPDFGRISYLGLNHLGFFTGIEAEGTDLVKRVIDERPDLGLGLDHGVLATIGALPLQHLKYFVHGGRMVETQKSKGPRADELLAMEADIEKEYRHGNGELPPTLSKRGAPWYEEAVVPFIEAALSDAPKPLIVDIPNDLAEGSRVVDGLPDKATVEVPAMVSKSGIKPIALAQSVPLPVMGLMGGVAAYEVLTAQAGVERSRSLAGAALLAHPMVKSFEDARGLLPLVEDLNKGLMPPLEG